MELITVELALLEELIRLVEEEDLTELTVEDQDLLIRIRGRHAHRGQMHQTFASPLVTPLPLTPSAIARHEPARNLYHIVSPLTGIFYSKPAPNAPPFIEIGSRVEEGQIVGLVESMKVFNEIVSDVNGVVVDISAQNEQLVQHGDTLVVIERMP